MAKQVFVFEKKKRKKEKEFIRNQKPLRTKVVTIIKKYITNKENNYV